ncbi:MAG: methyltransferase domain-containing protein [Desulfobacula sp.]|jgi:2-polyprenyl-3-methyl-5-hydroxy-6-metoxy-1,4-benzoquinol methylase|nr:methyltransferase domain-containing protein [Desulfobacula sp.]MBT7259887.1 methyltransferase domain-containing protein [Desulfobacula sp.]
MESQIKNHYNSDHLTANIKTALIKAGKNLSTLEPKDLYRIDQLHTGGANSSIELLKNINFSPDTPDITDTTGTQVLDAGCGIGGSSRLIAQQFGCKVTGLDLADKFINAANFLTTCTKQETQVSFKQGSILDLPFEKNTFDLVLCQHVLMNIKDKSRAVKEFFRVLKPGGKLVLHEITKGENQPVIFPVPWAASSAISFLEPWDILAATLEKQGFKMSYFSDKTHGACSWWEKVKAASDKKSTGVNVLGPGLIFGSNATLFGKNMHTNFKNNSICLVEAILKKSYNA